MGILKTAIAITFRLVATTTHEYLCNLLTWEPLAPLSFKYAQ